MRIWTSVVSIFILIISLHSPVWAEAKELELSHDYQRTGYSYHGIRTAVKASAEGKEHYGYIDEEGTIVVECAYRYALDFINGIGVLWYEQPDENNILCIAVDTKGKTIIEFDREVGYVEYYDGLHGIAVNNENHQSKYALLDANGNLLTGFIYDDIIYNQFTAHAEKIDENVLLVQIGDLYGFIDWDGNIVVPVQYSIKTRYSGFKDDSKLYPCYDQSGKGGYINTSGQIVIPFQYDEVNVFDRGYAAVKKMDTMDLSINMAPKYVIISMIDMVTLISDRLEMG
ncbi:MAG: WG repeat-containing protein [Syntrophomonadaceae bacterium]|nr:WG repeat-containing protein [Syntrophomonadaceae bacterium]